MKYISYEFKNQDCSTPYYKRREQLEALFKKNDYTYFKMLPVLYKGTDSNEILNWLNYNISQQTYSPKTFSDVSTNKFNKIHERLFTRRKSNQD